MALTLSEIKDLISFGHEAGLQQLQTEGLVVIYGQSPTQQQPFTGNAEGADDTANILAHYSAIGREKLVSRR